MRIRDTLPRLAAGRPLVQGFAGVGDRLGDLPDGYRNPGALGARTYVPDGLAPGAPLVVVLHGCTQTAAGYDAGTGWSRLADRAGFALLFPEQRRANNPNLCFNWFSSADIGRRGGEAESIAQMVGAMIGRHGLDRDRVFVTGLSAGGAMAAVMLATHPDLFAGGAIIGGLPYGSAEGVAEALRRMRAPGGGDARRLTGVAIGASGLTPSRWPTLSLWHGNADTTVAPGNMEDLAAQWCGVHGVAGAATWDESGANWSRRAWDADERTVVEAWLVRGMGHGVPIDPEHGFGMAGPFMLPVGLDSTTLIASSWGISTGPHIDAMPTPEGGGERAPSASQPERSPLSIYSTPSLSGVQKVIEDALRAAGLMN